MRPRTLRTELEKRGACFCQYFPHLRFPLLEMPRGFRNRLQFYQNIFSREFGVRIGGGRHVAGGLDTIMIAENAHRRSERRLELLLAPCIKGSLAMFGLPVLENAVGILRGEESAFLRGHVTPDVIENIASDCFEERFARDLKRLQVSDRQLRLVIKHFFEMRDVPERVDLVTVKRAAE